MELVYNAKKSGVDLSKKVYTCSVCGEPFNWGINSWYKIQIMDIDTMPWENILYACSNNCKIKLDKSSSRLDP